MLPPHAGLTNPLLTRGSTSACGDAAPLSASPPPPEPAASVPEVSGGPLGARFAPAARAVPLETAASASRLVEATADAAELRDAAEPRDVADRGAAVELGDGAACVDAADARVAADTPALTPRIANATVHRARGPVCTQLAGVVENARNSDGTTTSTWIASTRPR